MMKLMLGGFIVCAALLVGGGDDAAVKKERAKFKGTWKITRLETSKGDEDKGKDITLTFSDDGTMEMHKGGESKKATYKLNIAAKPKEIDIQPDDDKHPGKGIYEFAKDKLRICFSQGGPDSPRPTEFAVKDESRTIIVTLERAK
jgi:uncharacterized protein (TIGR03067 family)